MSDVLIDSDLPNRAHRGKVRDTYDLGDQLLIVATDRISAFDVVLGGGVPRKGEILTRLSAWWFDRIKEVVPNHFVALIRADNAHLVPFDLPAKYHGRSMLVRKAKRLDAECIARGYITGSGWKDYQRTGSVCGIPLPADLQESQRLEEPIFTPTTKAEVGHDEPITYDELTEIVGEDAANAMKLRTLALYNYAHTVALDRGIIIADTKFEFGLTEDGELRLIDELLTPDSSRFWAADSYQPGASPQSFDKQYVRDYLETLDWDKTAPGPHLPAVVIERTRQKYHEALQRLTGINAPE